MSAICGFKDYVITRALDIAADDDLDIEIAARELRVIADLDAEALQRAESDIARRLIEHPDDDRTERAFHLLNRAVGLSREPARRSPSVPVHAVWHSTHRGPGALDRFLHVIS